MTVTLRCLNCGFSFIVTYPEPRESEGITPVACGHCRCTRWSTQSA